VISTQALFDVGKWPVAVDERTGRHPRGAPPPPTAAGARLRPTSRATVLFASPTALRLFRRRRHVKPASTSTPAAFRSSIRGDEQPVVLLYDHPRTHTTRRWVAPQLAGSFFVVCPDLRGHGQSTPLPDVPEHAQPSMRAKTSCPLVTAACG
jgi:pimeloyl-ACP methyl ester carboxylesterase